MMSGRVPCADCDPSLASTASVSSDLHKYHVACSCGNDAGPASAAGQYAECAPTGPSDTINRKVERPPALPPRPPPRPRTNGTITRNAETPTTTLNSPLGPRKYVWWCMGMGAASFTLGALLLAAAMVLRTHTSSLHYLETIPTHVPAIMLGLTGVCLMSLARRRNRYSYLIKIVGACCLVCALTCVLVTITTTVIHMNRLQTLRECVYKEETLTCTCFSVLLDSHNTTVDEAIKCVFEDVSDCDVVHGALYSCLRAIFGLSVVGVLVCICSAMLAYQLLSHERKKMYWEQLELRCRSLYRPSSNQNTRSHNQQSQVCGECCAQCRTTAAVSWDLQQRFWASGRVGNLYSPNPVNGRRVSPWSWFPWSRNSNQRVGNSSGDSAYGFGNSPNGYWQLGPPPPYTPHHRYLHHLGSGMNSSHHHSHHSHSPNHLMHGCPMMSQSNRLAYPNSLTPHGSISDLENQHLNSTSHHHHHQGSLRMGMCGQPNQMHSSVRVLQCHDQAAIMSLSPGHFIPIDDNDRQSDESIVHRAECHHQNKPNMEEFSEKIEDNSHPQHTCQKHSQNSDVEVVDIQGEENLAFQSEKQTSPRQARGGESELYFADVSSCCNVSLKTVEYCAGLIGTIEHHADTSSGDSDVGSCPAFKGRPPRPRSNHPGFSSVRDGKSPPHQPNSIQWKNSNPHSGQCSSPNRLAKKKSPALSSDNEFSAHSGSVVQMQSSPSPKLNNSQRTSNVPYQDQLTCNECCNNTRITNLCRSNCQIIPGRNNEEMEPNASFNRGESSQNGFDHLREEVSRSSIRVRSSPNRSSMHRISSTPQRCSPNEANLSNINQKRKIIDDSLIIINNDLNSSNLRNRSGDESLVLNADNASFSQRWKGIDESSDSNSPISPLRRNVVDDLTDLNSSLLSLGHKCVEGANLNMNTSLSPRKRKDVEEQSKQRNMEIQAHGSENIRRKLGEESILSDSTTPSRRKYVDETLLPDSEIPMKISKKGIEEMFICNDPTRSNTENMYLNNSAEDFQRINNDELLFNKNLNLSIRKKNLEESLNGNMNACFNVNKRKGIDESILLNSDLNSLNSVRGRVFNDLGLIEDPDVRRKYVEDALMLINDVSDPTNEILRMKTMDEQMFHNDVNIGKLDLAHMMQHNARYSDNFLNPDNDIDEASLAIQTEGSRRGIIGGVCIAPDLRYEPVEGFKNNIPECENNDSTNRVAPIHMRCYSDSNTMDSGWQSGSEKHATD